MSSRSLLDTERLRRDLRWGATRGLAVGVAYTVVALALHLVRGGSPSAGSRLSMTALIALYLLGGLSAGVIVGVLRPLSRHRVGAYAVGIAATSPVMLAGFVLVVGQPDAWNWIHWLGVGVTSVGFGAVTGSELAPKAETPLPH